jgi:hypothetical protein
MWLLWAYLPRSRLGVWSQISCKKKNRLSEFGDSLDYRALGRAILPCIALLLSKPLLLDFKDLIFGNVLSPRINSVWYF